MGIEGSIRRLCEALTGTKIKAFRRQPRGIDPFDDFANHLPNLHVQTVLDVGANVGQTAAEFLRRFPESVVYCVEPVKETFRQLESAHRGNDRVSCFRFAMSSSRGSGKMVLGAKLEMNYLVEDSPADEPALAEAREDVEIETVDGFCADRRIDSIGFLKIDTEGHDLAVLKGAERLLAGQHIDAIQVEAGMNCENKTHVRFGDIDRFLEERYYFLFGIYEQIHEWPARQPHLRRTNPIYISRRVIAANPMN